MKAILIIILTTLLLILATIIVWANDVKMSASVEQSAMRTCIEQCGYEFK